MIKKDYDERAERSAVNQFRKGLPQEDIAGMTAEIAEGLRREGKKIDRKEITAILNTVVSMLDSEQVKRNGEYILKLIEEVPKFEMTSRR